MKNVFLIFLSLCAITFTSAQTEIGDAVLPNSETFGEHQLVLNGAGVREKFWIDMYVGALYLPKKSTDAKAILENGQPVAVKLYIVSRLISSERMSDAVDDGFRKSTKGNTAPFKKKIDKFKTFFSEEINKDDVFDITYQPALGVVVYKNGKKLGEIQGEDFKTAVFGIWLSEHPANEDLKKAMLGM
ncbi:MAG TPA: chalcone isomerase family protein [Flavobacteriaceae bacterium]|nr:chalcone isomerase family protein [Flavobacteriaceae bacterium]